MIRTILAKPFEWIMRAAGAINITIDGNSEWYCLNQSDLDIIIDDVIKLEGHVKETV